MDMWKIDYGRGKKETRKRQTEAGNPVRSLSPIEQV